MLLLSLLLIPLLGTILVSTNTNTMSLSVPSYETNRVAFSPRLVGLITSIVNLFVSIIVFLLFNFSSNQYQFVQEYHSINSIDFYLGVDGISIYFVLLTTIIMPIAILSN
jgi:NADH:ubiquinone oxidoreductase subunit 4 (subunit M)